MEECLKIIPLHLAGAYPRGGVRKPKPKTTGTYMPRVIDPEFALAHEASIVAHEIRVAAGMKKEDEARAFKE